MEVLYVSFREKESTYTLKVSVPVERVVLERTKLNTVKTRSTLNGTNLNGSYYTT